ncbi:MAG: DnaJ C-terminal domain-containing protein [bacterium]|nr:DnaJ C-terminal domain-containing protein [bacterium]
MPNKKDFYDVLGVNKSSSPEEIKRAYRKQALEWHPDRNKSDAATQKFKEINEAYEVLSNPEKKTAYDQFGHAAFEQGGMGGGGFGGQQQGGTYRQGPFTYYYGNNQGGFEDFAGFDFSDPFEIFEQFFGGASPSGRQARKPRYGLTLSFIEAVKGVEKEVIVNGKRRKLRIPAGVDTGSRINFPDFYVTIEVQSDPVFKREGQDLLIEVAIPFTSAVLGGTVTAPTIDGDVRLKIRPGTQPGTLLRLSGKGVPNLNRNGRGDQYVRFDVQIPQKLTSEQRKILEEFEQVSRKKDNKGWF